MIATAEFKCLLTVGACCGADFGERSCPAGLNDDARIRGWHTTKPRYAIWHCVSGSI
nr:hypothetical protein [uncultured Draconibacterium sp.]